MLGSRDANTEGQADSGSLRERAIPDDRSVAGNRGVHILHRIEGDRAHFLTLTFWDSRAAIKSASTAIGAKFLDPENLARVGMTYGSVEYLGKRLDESSYKELRARNPSAVVVAHFCELPRDQKLLDMAVLFPGSLIASDAMPWISTRTGPGD